MTPERTEEMREHNQEYRQAVLDGLYNHFCSVLNSPLKINGMELVAIATVLLDEYREENK